MQICRALNRGPLPDTLSALAEQQSGSQQPDGVEVENTEPEEFCYNGGGTAVLARPRTRITRKSEEER